ncbi:MAG: flagellar biosynthesis protein FlhF [Pseudomonadota bacterium]
MKIRRITAPDMRTAIRQVREELGADAVILSNKRVDEGVEIVAALDVEASLQMAVNKSASAPTGAAKTRQPDLAWPPRQVVRPGGIDLWEDTPAEPAASLRPLHEPAVVADEDLPDPYARDRQRASEQPATSPTPSAHAPVGPSPVVERLEEEVRSLRTLMESQLRVLEWRRYARHHPLQSELMRRLTAMGLAPGLAREVVEELGDAALEERGWDLALRALGARIPVLGEDITESGGMFALVGATGVGKTTTVAKLAARFVMRHGRKDIALVSTDNFRIGAYDQLRAYARILDIPLYVAEDAASLARTLDGLADRRLVLVDTAGMSQRDTRLMEQMRHLRSASSRLQSLLVVSASAQRAMTREAVQRFSQLPLAGCVLTKLDEAAQLGDALSAVIEAGLPLAWLGMGQRVPEDIAPARAERLVARAVELMQQSLDDEMSEERMSWDWKGAAAHG